MLLSKINVDAKRYQFRFAPYSLKTVEGICAEGVDPAKFDPIPLIRRGGRYVVGGDGHSRYEAVRRLAKDEPAKLPKRWRRGRDVDVPHRLVDDDEAQRLAWTANMIHHTFNPCEEARVFQAMIDAGRDVGDVAKLCQRRPAHVSKLLPLNGLCRDIRDAVGGDPEAGGIDFATACVLAVGFQRHEIEPQRQQEIWHGALKHAMLNFQSARKFIEAVGPKMKGRQGALFVLPKNAAAAMEEARQEASAARSASIGVSLLLKAAERGGLKGVPDLARWIRVHGQSAYDRLRKRVTADADVVAGMLKRV